MIPCFFVIKMLENIFGTETVVTLNKISVCAFLNLHNFNYVWIFIKRTLSNAQEKYNT